MAFSSSPPGTQVFVSKFSSLGKEIRLQGWGRERARGLEHLKMLERREVFRGGHITGHKNQMDGAPKANPE